MRKEIPPLQKPTMPIHSQGLGGEEPIDDEDSQSTNNDKIIKRINVDNPTL